MTKAIVVATLLFATISFLFCQENPPSSPPQSPTPDAFVGTWKFNPKKSSRSGTERESINIEVRDGAYRFTYDWLAENGTELNWWFVTDMKGVCVAHTQVNGQPMTSKSCVTRLTSHKFVDETILEISMKSAPMAGL